MSMVLNIRDRERTGKTNVLWKKRNELCVALQHMYIHEYLFDHHCLYDILIYLRDIVCANPNGVHLLYDCWLNLKDRDDTSIVWLATSYGTKSSDFELLEKVDEVKMFSL